VGGPLGQVDDQRAVGRPVEGHRPGTQQPHGGDAVLGRDTADDDAAVGIMSTPDNWPDPVAALTVVSTVRTNRMNGRARVPE
jgi:hypothetical protein